MSTHAYRAAICSALATIAISAASAQTGTTPQLSINGNDGTFTHVELRDGTSVRHSATGTEPLTEFALASGRTMKIKTSGIESCRVVTTSIPALSFHFDDYPDAEQIWLKEDYISTSLDISGNGATDDATALQLTVKGRGNSTWGLPKKPMRLKFAKKTSICGFQKAKNYVLLANYLDPTHMRNAIALYMAREMGVPFTNSAQPCDVFVNDRYTGTYLLTEKIGIKSESVDNDESQGILLELSTEYDEPYKFRSRHFNLPVMVKDPDFDELYEDDPATLSPDERLAAWQADFDKAETLVRAGKGEEAFDLRSYVDFIIVNRIARNNELGHPKSVYIHKERTGDDIKYVFGPVWDFDCVFNFDYNDNGTIRQTTYAGDLWLHPFLQHLEQSPGFKALYAERLNYFSDEVLPRLERYIDEYAAAIATSAALDGARWPDSTDYQWVYRVPSSDFPDRVSALKTWLRNRVAWLRTNTTN